MAIKKDDPQQASKDRAGFSTTVADSMQGVSKPYDQDSGPEVGNGFDADMAGEKRSKVTVLP